MPNKRPNAMQQRGLSPTAVRSWLERTFPDVEARKAYDDIGCGMRLCVPRDSSANEAWLMHGLYSRRQRACDDRRLSQNAVGLLLASGLLIEMTQQTENNREGWEHVGLPGDHFRIFACRQ